MKPLLNTISSSTTTITNIYKLRQWIKGFTCQKRDEEEKTMIEEDLFEFHYHSFVTSFSNASMLLIMLEGRK